MAIVETGTCTITQLNAQGVGMGVSPQGPVLLPYTLPGEEVAFERHAYRNKSNCVLTEVITPSPQRRAAPCPYFGTCGGCALQHVMPEAYGDVKVTMALGQQGNLAPEPLVALLPGTRRRANFQFVKKRDQVFFGYYKYHSDKIVDITHCPVVLPALSDMIAPLKVLLTQLMPNDTRGEIHALVAQNGIDLVWEIPHDLPLRSIPHAVVESFAQDHGVLRISVHRPQSTQVIVHRGDAVVTFGDTPVRVTGNSFLQASFEADKALADLVCSDLPKGARVVELFCGRGTLTFPLAQRGSVVAFEGDPVAVRSLKKALHDHPIVVHMRDLFKDPLVHQDFKVFDVAVLNPPRAGALTQCQNLAKSRIAHIRYVSCNPETFARDAQVLREAGYVLTRLTPVDQFPWSAHLELVGVFQRQTVGDLPEKKNR